ncbi:hypothetical protein L211DRAFT_854131 [Terfezia boudieri ATCC MYA-4762]|uniref:Yeast cell wall synthesis Kre9/Knh1-like N-terminal domain-containing protein n=1 Tax=Terfezia boudieri ATCC MYA-4762 TaxID=1051890 RepID=A0A3N4LKH0_9PEZI|nr:hypothetical protein L211DRAFT_854131 [Terfezia boudieri ATCC MYA-4762]
MRSIAILGTVLSAVAGIASAWTQPVGSPTGNPIARPTLHEKVPVSKPYTITWKPTLHPEGTVTLLLVKGPSDNVVPQYAIVEKTPNNGHYTWTPDASLPDSSEGWGIQLIVDSTGEYQWSTQFGFSNSGVVDHTTTTTTTATTEETSATQYLETTTEKSDYPITTTEESDYPTSTTTTVETTTTTPLKNTTTTDVTTSTTHTTTTVAETTTGEAEITIYGAPSTISTIIVTPTNSTIRPSAPAPTASTNGVSKNVVSFGMAVLALAVAGFSMF